MLCRYDSRVTILCKHSAWACHIAALGLKHSFTTHVCSYSWHRKDVFQLMLSLQVAVSKEA